MPHPLKILLKSKFQSGFVVDVLLVTKTTQEQRHNIVRQMLVNKFPGANLTELRGRHLRLDIPAGSRANFISILQDLDDLRRDRFGSRSRLVEGFSIKHWDLSNAFSKIVKGNSRSTHARRRRRRRRRTVEFDMGQVPDAIDSDRESAAQVLTETESCAHVGRDVTYDDEIDPATDEQIEDSQDADDTPSQVKIEHAKPRFLEI